MHAPSIFDLNLFFQNLIFFIFFEFNRFPRQSFVKIKMAAADDNPGAPCADVKLLLEETERTGIYSSITKNFSSSNLISELRLLKGLKSPFHLYLRNYFMQVLTIYSQNIYSYSFSIFFFFLLWRLKCLKHTGELTLTHGGAKLFSAKYFPRLHQIHPSNI